MRSPTQRSLADLRKNGWIAEVVERWVPGANVRKDLFGFVDIVAVREGEKPLLVQTTSRSNTSARLKKILASEVLKVLLGTFRIEVHGWAKNSKGRWEVKVIDVELQQ